MRPEHRTRCISAMMRQGKLSESVANILIDAGYQTAPWLRRATNEELLAIEGIGPINVRKIRTWVGGPT